MNREWVLHHLREAHEELGRTIGEITETPDYDSGEFLVSMSHLYHHLNTACNARDASESAVREVTAEDFRRWSAFPADVVVFE
jgi:hypothetical protein